MPAPLPKNGITQAPWSQNSAKSVMNITNNAAYNAVTSQWVYLNDGAATRIEMGDDGYLRSFSTGSGTAGGVITWGTAYASSGDFVLKAGDTMSGSLTIASSTNQLQLIDSNSSTPLNGFLFSHDDDALYLGHYNPSTFAYKQFAHFRSDFIAATIGGNTGIGNHPVHGATYAGFWNHTAQSTLDGNYYALLAQSDGATFINARSTKTISLSVNNTARMTVQSDRIEFTSGTYLYSLGGASASQYGALTVRGEKASWSGINFRSGSNANVGTFMADTGGTTQGFYNAADNAWHWQFQSGTLITGRVKSATSTGGDTGTSDSNIVQGQGNQRTAYWTSASGNNILPCGFINPVTDSTMPNTGWWLGINMAHVSNSSGNQYQAQLVTPMTGNATTDQRMYLRRNNGNSWGGWFPIYISSAANLGERDVARDGNGKVYVQDIVASRNSTQGVIYLNAGQTAFVYYNGSNYEMPNGSLVVNGTNYPSSETVKREIVDYDLTVEDFLKLRPVRYAYNHDSTGTTRAGFIAEEVRLFDPTLVREYVTNDPNDAPQATKVDTTTGELIEIPPEERTLKTVVPTTAISLDPMEMAATAIAMSRAVYRRVDNRLDRAAETFTKNNQDLEAKASLLQQSFVRIKPDPLIVDKVKNLQNQLTAAGNTQLTPAQLNGALRIIVESQIEIMSRLNGE